MEEGAECPARAMHLTNVCPDVSAERKELKNTCLGAYFKDVLPKASTSLSNVYLHTDLSAALRTTLIVAYMGRGPAEETLASIQSPTWRLSLTTSSTLPS